MARDLFLQVSGAKYDSMRARFKPKYRDDVSLRVPGREIPFSKEDFRGWLLPLYEAGLRCAYCERRLKLGEIEPDHIVPVKKLGGSLALSNICVACRDCNIRKGDLAGDEWRALLKGLATFPEAARRYVFQKLAQRPVFRPQAPRDGSAPPRSPRPKALKPRKADPEPGSLFDTF
jgi:5-methylcytosine-specific restriction endonuclease McrA